MGKKRTRRIAALLLSLLGGIALAALESRTAQLAGWLAGQDREEALLTGDIALVVGGENSGIGALTRKKCDKILSLPLYGKVNSLNASVALGIAAYEAVRQRR